MNKRGLIALWLYAHMIPAISILSASDVFDGLVLPYREVTIGSPVETRIDTLEVREGDKVKKGDLLVRLYSRLEELEVERAAVVVEKRVFDEKSASNLFKDRLISEDEALEARIELDLAKLMLEIAEEQVELRRLRAPIDGVVVERLHEAGEMVQMSESIFVLLDLEQVYVQFYVDVENLKNVAIGGKVEVIFPNLGSQNIRVGTIDYIDPRVNAASGLSRVRLLLQNTDKYIKAGVRVSVRLLESNE